MRGVGVSARVPQRFSTLADRGLPGGSHATARARDPARTAEPIDSVLLFLAICLEGVVEVVLHRTIALSQERISRPWERGLAANPDGGINA